MQDFDNLMNEILDFAEVTPAAELIEAIKKTADRQRDYVSGHKYDLEKFGLTEEKIRQDYTPIYETFLS